MNEESNAFGQEVSVKEKSAAFCCQFVSSDGSFEPHPPIGSPITVCFYEFVFGAVDKEKFDVFSVKADGGYSFTFYESRVPRSEKEKFFFLLCDLAVSLGKLRTQFADFCFEGVPLRNEAAFFANRLSELNGVCREALRRIEFVPEPVDGSPDGSQGLPGEEVYFSPKEDSQGDDGKGGNLRCGFFENVGDEVGNHVPDRGTNGVSEQSPILPWKNEVFLSLAGGAVVGSIILWGIYTLNPNSLNGNFLCGVAIGGCCFLILKLAPVLYRKFRRSS